MDNTKTIRQQLTTEINLIKAERANIEAEYGQVWTTEEMQREFKPLGFMSPFIIVERINDGVKGSLMFQHAPHFYFSFKEEK